MMSPIFKIPCLFLITLLGTEVTDLNPKDSFSLEVKIEGVMVDKGTFYIALYNSESSFLKKAAFSNKFSFKDVAKKHIFSNLTKGEYAITLYQDLNDNGELDKIFAVPIEPYGISNNVDGFPSFSKAKFILAGNKIISIKIKN
jgi:uncharacterized protein (DUF2141 family)